jgi:tRNA(adenine34) deaminase
LRPAGHEHLLATGDAPLPPGFAQWREMCAKKPLYGVARLLARGNPHLSAAECAAYDAPFPDRGYRAALRAFPALVPGQADAEGAPRRRAARDFWQHDWQGRSLMAVGGARPGAGHARHAGAATHIRGCPPPIVLPQAGHFVPEHGQALAVQAVEYFRP